MINHIMTQKSEENMEIIPAERDRAACGRPRGCHTTSHSDTVFVCVCVFVGVGVGVCVCVCACVCVCV